MSAAASARTPAGSWPGRSCWPRSSLPPILFAAFGFFGAARSPSSPASNDYLWLPLALAVRGIVWFLTYRGISISTRTGVVLGLIEIGIFVVVSLLLIINAGDRNTASVFIPGATGIQPALQGMVFCLLAFVGFEAAAPLAEETRDPKRNTRRAIVWSAILIGMFYVFCYYAATVYFGPDNMADFIAPTTATRGAAWPRRCCRGSAACWWSSRSSTAVSPTPTPAPTRRRDRSSRSDAPDCFPGASGPSTRSIGRRPTRSTSRRSSGSSSPSASAWFWPAVSRTPGPLNTYFTIGYAIGLSFAGMYMAVNLAVIGYFWREHRDEFNWLKHLIIPVIGFITDDPGLPRRPRRGHDPDRRPELARSTEPYSFVPPLVAIWMIVGIVVGSAFEPPVRAARSPRSGWASPRPDGAEPRS